MIETGVVPTLILMLNAWVAVWEFTSVTRTVKLLVPLADGLPEITPVEGASDNPEGKLPDAMTDRRYYNIKTMQAVHLK